MGPLPYDLSPPPRHGGWGFPSILSPRASLPGVALPSSLGWRGGWAGLWGWDVVRPLWWGQQLAGRGRAWQSPLCSEYSSLLKTPQLQSFALKGAVCAVVNQV